MAAYKKSSCVSSLSHDFEEVQCFLQSQPAVAMRIPLQVTTVIVENKVQEADEETFWKLVSEERLKDEGYAEDTIASEQTRFVAEGVASLVQLESQEDSWSALGSLAGALQGDSGGTFQEAIKEQIVLIGYLCSMPQDPSNCTDRDVQDWKDAVKGAQDEKQEVIHSITMYKHGRELLRQCHKSIERAELVLQKKTKTQEQVNALLSRLRSEKAKVADGESSFDWLRMWEEIAMLDESCEKTPCLVDVIAPSGLLKSALEPLLQAWISEFKVLVQAGKEKSVQSFLQSASIKGVLAPLKVAAGLKQIVEPAGH
eukprot:12416254-Karenia_brevis.AAC.1